LTHIQRLFVDNCSVNSIIVVIIMITAAF